MKDEANEMIRSEQEKVNISQDNLGKWRWESPYYKVSTSRGFSSQSQALDNARRFLAEQRGEIEHEDYER